MNNSIVAASSRPISAGFIPGHVSAGRVIPERPAFLAAGAAAVALLSGLLGPVMAAEPAMDRATPEAQAPSATDLADSGHLSASPDAQRVADWVLASRDAQGRPYMLVDKKQARLYVFSPAGELLGASPVLIGLASGDDSVPGIGERELDQVQPHERTTPAGRFATEPGRNLKGEDIVWIDYDAAVSMHRVRANVAAQRRLERLATPTPLDNRISYGCINVPTAFYDRWIQPLFAHGRGVAYVLPDTRRLEQVFANLPGNARKTLPTPTAWRGAAELPSRAHQ